MTKKANYPLENRSLSEIRKACHKKKRRKLPLPFTWVCSYAAERHWEFTNYIPGFSCKLFICMIMSWLRRFANGYIEPGYMGESFADSTGALILEGERV